MEHSFWFDKWEKNDIGFHQSDYNKLLLKYWADLKLEKGSEVFVPFCGKSKDMLWLNKQRHKILGNEISKIAVDAFFQENHLEVATDFDKEFSISKNKDFQIRVGDFFSLTPSHTKQVKGVYDRASLFALPSNLRKEYANHMKKLLKKDCVILLITLEYEKNLIKPPPFDIQAKEVFELYSSWCKIKKLETLPAVIKGNNGYETAYRLDVKNSKI